MSFTPFVDFAMDRDHDGLTEVPMSGKVHRPGCRALHSHSTHVMYFFTCFVRQLMLAVFTCIDSV